MPAVVGVATAEITLVPRFEGFQLHVATIFGEVPDVRNPMHPGIRRLFTLKVTLAGTETLALICTTVL